MSELVISDDAFNLIVAEEDSDAAYYTPHYQHFDWPQGASGPTIGIGYDCGYVTAAEEGSLFASTIALYLDQIAAALGATLAGQSPAWPSASVTVTG